MTPSPKISVSSRIPLRDPAVGMTEALLNRIGTLDSNGPGPISTIFAHGKPTIVANTFSSNTN